MKKYFVLIALLVFCSTLTYSQNALDTLWQLYSGASPEMGKFIGFAQNPQDSSLLVSYIDDNDHNNIQYYLANVNSKAGTIAKKMPNNCVFWQTYFLNDNNNIIIRNPDVAIQNKDNFEVLFYDKIDSYDLFYNKQLDKAITSSNSLVKIYDTKEKKIIKEYNSFNFFNRSDVQVRKVAISNYNNYAIYSCLNYDINSKPISQLIVLDSNGKVLYKDEKSRVNSTPFERVLALSNNQKLIVYCSGDKFIKILDLSTLQVVKSVLYSGGDPLFFRFSPDDKKVFCGCENGLFDLDLDTQQIQWLLEGGKVYNFDFDLFNLNIIYDCHSGLIWSRKIKDLTEVDNPAPSTNEYKINYNQVQKSLNLQMNLNTNGNFTITLYNINSVPSKLLENGMLQNGKYERNYDISNIPNGSYYIQVKINNQVVPLNLSFIKAN